jgi:hypothetical protein
MRGEPSIAEWEQTLDADLMHHLIPAGPLPGMRRPADVNELPRRHPARARHLAVRPTGESARPPRRFAACPAPRY